MKKKSVKSVKAWAITKNGNINHYPGLLIFRQLKNAKVHAILPTDKIIPVLITPIK